MEFFFYIDAPLTTHSRPPLSLPVIFTAVFGFGMGGYASIRALVDAASSFGLFAKVYSGL